MREQLETAAINKIKALNAKHLKDIKGSIDTDKASVGRPGADVHKSRRKLLLKHKGQHVSEEEGNKEGKLKPDEKPCEICQDHSCDKCQAKIDKNEKDKGDGDIINAPSDDNDDNVSVESVASIILRVLDEQNPRGRAGMGRKPGAEGKGGTQLLVGTGLEKAKARFAKAAAAKAKASAKPASTAVAVKSVTTGPSETWVNALKLDVSAALKRLGEKQGNPGLYNNHIKGFHDHIEKYQHRLHSTMKDLSKEQLASDNHRYNMVRADIDKNNKGE